MYAFKGKSVEMYLIISAAYLYEIYGFIGQAIKFSKLVDFFSFMFRQRMCVSIRVENVRRRS